MEGPQEEVAAVLEGRPSQAWAAAEEVVEGAWLCVELKLFRQTS